MTMKTARGFCIAFVFAIQCVPAFAERKPNAPKDAKLVVWGTVQKVVRSETDEFNKFKVKIRVENRERGNLRGKKIVWANCFQRKPSAPRVPSASGHKAIPKKGQFIRALLLEPRRGEFEGIYPDWFHELKLNDDQLAAMRWARTIGRSSSLGCDDSLPGRPVTSMHLFKMWDSGVTDADMKHVKVFPELRTLGLLYSRVRGDGLKTVATLKNLEDLNLGNFQGVIRDEDLHPLAGSKSLRSLSLLNARITDRAMSQFAAMPSLRSLRVGATRITDAGLEELKQHQGLESLSVARTRITDRGVEHLEAMKSLKRLRLDSTAITDKALKSLTSLSLIDLGLRDCRKVTEAGLVHVAAHKELQMLNLQNTRATDAIMKTLSELKDLRKITLQSTQVTDTGLLHLTKCSELVRVSIAHTRITSEGVQKFKRALPNCTVNRATIE